MVKRILLGIAILILQVACSPQALTQDSTLAAQDQPPISTQSSPEPELFQVKAWVNDETPSIDSRIVVRGSLIKYGSHYMGGIMMSAVWPGDSTDRGVPNCFTQVTYGTGKCVIDVSHFPPGEFVPVTISFDYQGKIYTAQTGFTPQEP